MSLCWCPAHPATSAHLGAWQRCHLHDRSLSAPTQYPPPAWSVGSLTPVFPDLNGLAHCGPSSNFHGDLIEAFGHVEVGPAAKPDMIFGKDKPRPESGPQRLSFRGQIGVQARCERAMLTAWLSRPQIAPMRSRRMSRTP